MEPTGTKAGASDSYTYGGDPNDVAMLDPNDVAVRIHSLFKNAGSTSKLDEIKNELKLNYSGREGTVLRVMVEFFKQGRENLIQDS